MDPTTELELEGTFVTNTLAELFAEIAHADITGSIRAANGERKAVFYFKSGRLVFAVSNARSSRLFDMLLSRGRLSESDLPKLENFVNDLELTRQLISNGTITEEERKQLFAEQIEGILVDALSWPTGNWSFSSLTRVRDGLEFKVDVEKRLMQFARVMPEDRLLARFRSLNDKFAITGRRPAEITLTPPEVAVVSKLGSNMVSADEIIATSGLPQVTTLHVLYTLWIGGVLKRTDWNPVFTEMKISALRGARLELKREAKHEGAPIKVETKEEVPVAVPEAPAPVEIPLTAEEYLERVEGAITHYDILGVDPSAEVAAIKRAYFTLAKTFHPDHFHQEGGEIVRRMQVAFTQLTQAHETLKQPELRETYDLKMRKEIADRKKDNEAGTYDEISKKLREAGEAFEQGFALYMNNDLESAVTYLARAAHFDPDNARYRAYYGKTLAADPKKQHKAESEMQTAVKLDPNNPTFRLMLAEFFVQVNLKKRAEGELNRLLAIFPSNREARNMLDSLQA